MKLLGKKLFMTSVFDKSRTQIPVTVLEIGPCQITQIKNRESDGYQAVQIGYGSTKESRITKPVKGHLKKSGDANLSNLMEFRTTETEKFKLGEMLKVDQFLVGDLIDVTSRSKGRGFAGVVKKFGFRGGPKSHGQSDRLRAPGSIGASSYPSRVIKGMRMPGQFGNKKVTTKNLEVVYVDSEKNLMHVKGAVPGSRNTLVVVSKG